MLSFCLAAAIAVLSTASHIVDVAVSTCRAFKNYMVDRFMAVMATPEPQKASQVWFVQTREFVARILRRQRPVVTSSWRMCPSI